MAKIVNINFSGENAAQTRFFKDFWGADGEGLKGETTKETLHYIVRARFGMILGALVGAPMPDRNPITWLLNGFGNEPSANEFMETKKKYQEMVQAVPEIREIQKALIDLYMNVDWQDSRKWTAYDNKGIIFNINWYAPAAYEDGQETYQGTISYHFAGRGGVPQDSESKNVNNTGTMIRLDYNGFFGAFGAFFEKLGNVGDKYWPLGNDYYTTGEFMKDVGKAIGHWASLDFSLFIENPGLKKLLGAGGDYGWDDSLKAISDNVTKKIQNIGNGEVTYTFSLTSHDDEIWDALRPQYVHKTAGNGWVLGQDNSTGAGPLTSKFIPDSFFSTDGASVSAEELAANSMISEFFDRRITYSGAKGGLLQANNVTGYTTTDVTEGIGDGAEGVNLSGTSGTEGALHGSEKEMAKFMEKLKEFSIVGKDVTTLELTEGNLDWGVDAWLWDKFQTWGIFLPILGPWALYWGVAAAVYGFVGMATSEDGAWPGWEGERPNPFKVAVETAYGQFLQGIGTAPAGKKYSTMKRLWREIYEGEGESDSVSGLYDTLVELIMKEKEIDRRVTKWNFLADQASLGDVKALQGGLYRESEEGAWDQQAVELEEQLGDLQGEAFKDISGEAEGIQSEDGLTQEEIADRQKFYKQCALMLNAHGLKDRLYNRLAQEVLPLDERQNVYDETDGSENWGEYTEGVASHEDAGLPFGGRFWMAQCGGDQERLIGNLAASSDGATFFDVPPAVMTYLTPKLRLFRVRNNTSGGLEEIEFIFGQFQDIDRKQNYVNTQETFLNASFDKGSGAGVKEFSWEFKGTTPSTARNDITANLTLYFQTFNDFIRPRAGRDGNQYRFVDLVIQPTPDDHNKINNLEIIHPSQYDPSFYRIRAEIGYYEPDNQVHYSNISSLQRAIRRTNRSFYLCMVNHNINVHDDGTVTVEISYRAYVETALKTLRFDALTTPELIARKKQLDKELQEMISSGRCTEQEIRDYKVVLQAFHEEYRKQSLQSIIRRLIVRGKIYICEVDDADRQHFLSNGYFRKCDLIPARTKRVEGGGLPSAEAILLSERGNTGNLSDLLRTDLDDDYDYTNMQDTSIQFFYFGDLLDVISDVLYNTDGSLVEGMENTKYILGSFEFDPYSGDGKDNPVINIAQIPISVDYFSAWFADQVLSKGSTRESFPIINFIRTLCNYLLSPTLLEACVNRKVKKTLRFSTGQISAFSQLSNKADPLEHLAKKHIIINTEHGEGYLPLAGDSNELKEKLKGFYNYIVLNVLGSSLTYTGTGIYEEDIALGRYHVNIGSNRGIVKKISFNQADIQYIREARFLQNGINGLLQLAAVYNVDVEMFGNTLFYPGMELFVNPFGIGGTEFGSPTQGPGYVGGRSMANIMGLGGYHTITEVRSSLTPNSFNTTVKALQYYSGDGQGNPNLMGQARHQEVTSSLSDQQRAANGDKKYCEGLVDKLIGSIEEWSTFQGPDYTPPPIEAQKPKDGGGATLGEVRDAAYEEPEEFDGLKTIAFKYTHEKKGEKWEATEYLSKYEMADEKDKIAVSYTTASKNTEKSKGDVTVYDFKIRDILVMQMGVEKIPNTMGQEHQEVVQYNIFHGENAGRSVKHHISTQSLKEGQSTLAGFDEESLQGASPPVETEDGPINLFDVTDNVHDTEYEHLTSYQRLLTVTEDEGELTEAQQELFSDVETEENTLAWLDENNKSAVDPGYFVILGDSQTQNGAMGQLLEQWLKSDQHKTENSLTTVSVKRIGKGDLPGGESAAGKTVKYYATGKGKAAVADAVSGLQFEIQKAPKHIYIFLGGNGSAEESAQYTKQLLSEIRTYAPSSRIYWFLPPPPANHELYRTKKEGSYPGDYEARRLKSEAIKSAVLSSGHVAIRWIDTYSMVAWPKIENGIWGEPYANPQTIKDGIHVKGEARYTVLRAFSVIADDWSA